MRSVQWHSLSVILSLILYNTAPTETPFPKSWKLLTENLNSFCGFLRYHYDSSGISLVSNKLKTKTRHKNENKFEAKLVCSQIEQILPDLVHMHQTVLKSSQKAKTTTKR